MPKGSYVLVIELDRPVAIEVGALGEIGFEAGGYAYVGSAFGPGGLSRVDRHRELAAGERSTRHWHVDYLLCHPAASLYEAVTFPGRDVECELASDLPGRPIDRFGASDCPCDSHLLWTNEPDRLLQAARRV